ncbi:MAG TPA: beta-N-acetylhexosaminidase [Chloroflexi bacterium]|nr:beta-N-acetylhexosaminidase [Chloroflexota bacterium]
MSLDTLNTLTPKPAHVAALPGTFTFTSPVGVWTDAGAGDVAALVQAELGRAAGLAFQPADAASAQLVLRLTGDEANSERYTLTVNTHRVEIVAPATAGLIHGFFTLRQLLPAANWRAAPLPGVAWSAPCCTIEDAPRFGWRGCMLDVVRHFAPKQTILRFVDLLAMHHFNRLHLHLTDDQGWRVEIKAFPKLTEIGAHRPNTGLGFATSTADPHDGTPHGGYYTQDDLREIVAYAAVRGVTVVPEIELPGHARALVAAYPEFGCLETPVEVATYFGISRDLINPLPHTVAALEKILEEVIAIFPSPWLHVGGDEAPLDQWRSSPQIRAYMASLGIANAEALRTHFTAQLTAFLAAHGRRMVGWDEMIHYGGLAPDSVIMSWRGEKGGMKAAQAGYSVIMAPVFPTYFDYAQDTGSDEPLAIGDGATLEDVYTYEPSARWPDTASFAKVLGVQCQLWREVILDDAHLEYMAFPRACALAEVGWSAQCDDFADFQARLGQHLQRLDAYGVNYRPLAGPRPWQKGGAGRKAHQPRFNLKEALAHLDEWAESGEPPAEHLAD